jgi:hypothetical protein
MSTSPQSHNDPAFEVTEFGRRRVSRVPGTLRFAWRIVRGTALWVYHKVFPLPT